MANPVRSEATALEVPVTIQGSKTVEGTDQRELFTENTKTTLIFANGAVVKLSAKVQAGQCVFLRNDQSEREILCKVLESRQAGQAGYTDLEFTSYDPDFWNAPAEQPAPATTQSTAQSKPEPAVKIPVAAPATESGAATNGNKSETQKKIEAAVKNLTPAPAVESNAQISAEIPLQFEQPPAPKPQLEVQDRIEAAANTPIVTPNANSNAPIAAQTSVFAQSAALVNNESTLVASAAPIVLEAAHESLASPKTHESTLVASAAPIMLESAHESLAALKTHEPTDEELDWNAVKDAEMLAALATMEAGSKANREPAKEPGEEEEANATGREAKSPRVQEKGESTSRVVTENKPRFAHISPTRKLREFTSIEKPVAIGIGAGFVLAASLALFWHMKTSITVQSSNRPVTVSTQYKSAPSLAATPAQKPGSAPAASPGANNAGASPAQKPGATVAAPGNNPVGDSPAVAAAKLAAKGELSRSDQEVLGIARRNGGDKNATGNTPARIVSQSQPAVPPWLKGLDVDQVVKLDALIDEKGNLVETKPISGPRLLQAEAERAVALWVFEPAMTAGKPTASRLVLVVQFQK
jgi:hypothetical protein